MTTQGKAKYNRNNHPFTGNVPGTRFALAHNGVLYNDRTLRREKKLPKTNNRYTYSTWPSSSSNSKEPSHRPA